MKQSKRIIVEKGAVLFIDHSLLTNSDEKNNTNQPNSYNPTGKYWKGIEVFSDTPYVCQDKPMLQSFVGNPEGTYWDNYTPCPGGGPLVPICYPVTYNYGIVVAKSSEFRYANTAIMVYNSGYVSSTNNLFLNNEKDTWISPYNYIWKKGHPLPLYTSHSCAVNYSENIGNTYEVRNNEQASKIWKAYPTAPPKWDTSLTKKISIQLDFQIASTVKNCIFKLYPTNPGNANKPYEAYWTGIYSNSSLVYLDADSFFNLYSGVYATDPTSRNMFSSTGTGEKTYFSNTHYSVYVQGGENVSIGYSTFNYPYSRAFRYAGVYLDGAGSYHIYGNTFNRKPFENLHVVTNESGIYTVGSNLGVGFIECNFMNRMTNGVFSYALNNNLKLWGNTFDTTRLNDILIDSDDISKTYVGGIFPVQGNNSQSLSASNLFNQRDTSHLVYKNGVKIKVKTKHIVKKIDNPATTLKYYYYSTGRQKPLWNTDFGGKLTPSNINIANTYQCSNGGHGEINSGAAFDTVQMRSKEEWDGLFSGVSDMEANGIDEDNIEDYMHLKYDFDNVSHYLATWWAKQYVMDGNNMNYLDSITSILNLYPSFNNRHDLLRFFLWTNQLDSATALVSVLETDSSTNQWVLDLCTYYNHVIAILDHNEDSAWFATHRHDIDSLVPLSNLAGARARALYSWAASSDYVDYIGWDLADYQQPHPEVALDTLDIIADIDTATALVSLAATPVPFSNTLNISLENQAGSTRTFDVLLNSLYMHTYLTQQPTISANQTWGYEFDSSGLPNGLYYLSVFENGELIAYKFLLKN